jgi:hypothetical protein
MSGAQLVLIELILIFGFVIWFGLSELKKLRDKRNSPDVTKQFPRDNSDEQKRDG